jgi:hypothetical protein
MSAQIEALLLPLFRRQAKAITVADARKMLGNKHSPAEVTATCIEMRNKGLIQSTKSGAVNLYEIVTHAPTKHQSQAIYWAPLRPARQTVIPIRERGRIAPDCSDGPYIAMVSRAEYYGRIDA